MVRWSLTGSFTDSNLTDRGTNRDFGEVVAYRRWPLTGSFITVIAISLMEEPIRVLVRWSLKRGGHLQEVVAQGGSTVEY